VPATEKLRQLGVACGGARGAVQRGRTRIIRVAAVRPRINEGPTQVALNVRSARLTAVGAWRVNWRDVLRVAGQSRRLRKVQGSASGGLTGTAALGRFQDPRGPLQG